MKGKGKPNKGERSNNKKKGKNKIKGIIISKSYFF